MGLLDEVYSFYFVQLLPYYFISQIYILNFCLPLVFPPQIWIILSVRINLLNK